MTKINLLPPEKIKRKRGAPGGKTIWLSAILPILVIAIIGVWWFSLGSQVKEKDDSINMAKQDLTDWKAKNKALEQYEVRLQEIKAKEEVVVRAISGRIYWARVLDDIARYCPSDIWLTSVACTGSETEGSVEFQGLAKQCRNRWARYIQNAVKYQVLLPNLFPGYSESVSTPSRPDIAADEEYRFHSDGTMGGDLYVYYPDYRPIARWIERMEQVPEFARVWLSTASPEWHAYGAAGVFEFQELDGVPGTSAQDVVKWEAEQGDYLMNFSSRATLNMNTAQIGPPLSAATAAAAPAQPKTESTGEEGATE